MPAGIRDTRIWCDFARSQRPRRERDFGSSGFLPPDDRSRPQINPEVGVVVTVLNQTESGDIDLLSSKMPESHTTYR